MNHDFYPDDLIRNILTSTKTIALVGASPKPERPSYGVMATLLRKGYKVIPVNPGQAGKQIHGQTVVANLADIDVPVDMIDVFRAPEQMGDVIDDVFKMKSHPRYIWGQLGVRDDAAAARAEEKGITVVMNRCPAIEIPRLGL
ncbi:CoA-binding protein [Rhizobium sp. C4]|uniref:CoA-binding protein n=1 Tax=Rhizobium sp. C4 TaxID=1349800 RepID=UPI001E6553A8|nr:CoA-binding protein [Rhizobium sp. C4]MCD2171608.1 CoA-binding protein [Rhizobium sp. C4]